MTLKSSRARRLSLALAAACCLAGLPLPAQEAATVHNVPLGKTPLQTTPQIISIPHLEPEQMKPQDTALVESLHTGLLAKAALYGIDLNRPDWHYRQIACPVLHEHVALAFSRGEAGEDGAGAGSGKGEHFIAVLPRQGSDVRILSIPSHGFYSLASSWSGPGTHDTVNRVLDSEGGLRPIGQRPDWLVLGLCYAELTGYPVQVLAASYHPDDTLDLQRLGADRPQLRIAADESTEITFSDVSEPAITTNWTLRFNRRGQLTSARRERERQPRSIALQP